MPKNINYKNLTNQQFGYLTALYIDEIKTKSNSHTYWVCKCCCGKLRSLQVHQLTSSKVTSCGCKNKRILKSTFISKHHRMYTLYSSMVARCHNPKSTSYKSYGAKGIFVCEEWRNNFNSFCEWAMNNGYSDELSIDRIDNSKGYTPTNCRWVTWDEQMRNKTTNVWYEHNGESHTMAEWCDILGFSRHLAKSRRKIAKRQGIEPTFEYVFSPPKYHRKFKSII